MTLVLKETSEVHFRSANQSRADTVVSEKIKFADFMDYFLMYYHCTNSVRAMRKEPLAFHLLQQSPLSSVSVCISAVQV